MKDVNQLLDLLAEVKRLFFFILFYCENRTKRTTLRQHLHPLLKRIVAAQAYCCRQRRAPALLEMRIGEDLKLFARLLIQLTDVH